MKSEEQQIRKPLRQQLKRPKLGPMVYTISLTEYDIASLAQSLVTVPWLI